jgi:hypothetical protein
VGTGLEACPIDSLVERETLRVLSKSIIRVDRFTGKSIYILRTDKELLALVANMLEIFIPAAGFAHIEGVLAYFGEAGGIVAVVVYHTAEDGVSANHKKIYVRCPRFAIMRRSFVSCQEFRKKTHPIPLYISTATLFPALT